METKLCKEQGKMSNSDFIFSPKTVLAQLCWEARLVCWGISVMVAPGAHRQGMIRLDGNLAKMCLKLCPWFRFPIIEWLFRQIRSSNISSCIAVTIVLRVAFLACHAAGKEELEWHIAPWMHRFNSCWDVDPAPGTCWSLVIFTAATTWCHARAGWEMQAVLDSH